jgi:DedD protein
MAFFKFRSTSAKTPDASAGAASTVQSLEVMRRRAQHRLMGAALLVLLGVVGFPLLFDSQPRPVVADIAIDIPDKTKAKPLLLPASEPVAQPAAAVTAVVPAAPEATPSAPVVAAPAAAAPPVAAVSKAKANPEPKPQPKAETKPESKPAADAAKPADGARAQALLEGKVGNSSVGGRFVVQVGAYSDNAKLREVRQKLEKSGLKTYTQAVDSKEGARTRVRVGPFDSQAEADKAASKIKALDLPAAVLKM